MFIHICLILRTYVAFHLIFRFYFNFSKRKCSGKTFGKYERVDRRTKTEHNFREMSQEVKRVFVIFYKSFRSIPDLTSLFYDDGFVLCKNIYEAHTHYYVHCSTCNFITNSNVFKVKKKTNTMLLSTNH